MELIEVLHATGMYVLKQAVCNRMRKLMADMTEKIVSLSLDNHKGLDDWSTQATKRSLLENNLPTL